MGFDVTNHHPKTAGEESSPVRSRAPEHLGSSPPERLDSYEDRVRRYGDPRRPTLASPNPRPASPEVPAASEPAASPVTADPPLQDPVFEQQPGGPSDAELGIPERKPVRGLGLLAILLGVGVTAAMLGLLVVRLIAGGEGRTSPNDDARPSVIGSPAAAGVIGAPLRVGTLAFEVHGLREVPLGQAEQPAPGMRWVAVDIEVVNEGQDQAAISMLSMFDLEDSTGTQHLPTIIGSVARYAEGDLLPGLRLRGEVVFEVPGDASGFTLVILTPDRSRTGRVALS